MKESFLHEAGFLGAIFEGTDLCLKQLEEMLIHLLNVGYKE
jgi:hypothetical protein